ncbi:SAM-dependent methyltransferase [Salinibacter sp.]|uniref:SAM-dependent methyltransferase n=1 Tax=Salinibacter sp. TaxID=2065818 RepID=UPI0021E924C2
MSDSPRPSSRPDFWDVRYEQDRHLFGAEPNAFVKAAAHRLPPESPVVELGAGEGRTAAWLAWEHGHRVTAVDFSEAALKTAQERAEAEHLRLDTVRADVRTGRPDRQWDAAVVTFLQLLPDERLHLCRLLKTSVRSGGWLLAEWLRPAHLTGPYHRIPYHRMGPSRADRMVPGASGLRGRAPCVCGGRRRAPPGRPSPHWGRRCRSGRCAGRRGLEEKRPWGTAPRLSSKWPCPVVKASRVDIAGGRRYICTYKTVGHTSPASFLS